MRILRLFLIFYLLNFVGLEVFAEGKDYAQCKSIYWNSR